MFLQGFPGRINVKIHYLLLYQRIDLSGETR